MKEFIDKLIERLEEEHERCINRYGIVGGNAPAMEVKQCIDIINELAEEYKDKLIIDGQYCWQTCGATEHCKECNRLCNGSIDFYENYDFMAEEYKVSEMPTGWIACSERLPEEHCKVLVSLENGYVGEAWFGFGEFKRLSPQKGGGMKSFYDNNKPIAWQPLPAPSKEGE